MYIGKLNDIADKYKNTYHCSIKLKPLNVELSANYNFDIKNNDKDSNFKVGEDVRILKYKSSSAKGYT